MKRVLIQVLIIAIMIATPSVTSAAALSASQVSAIVGLLSAFGVDHAVIVQIEQQLSASGGAAVVAAPVIDSAATTSAYVPPEDNIYPLGSIGYDLSYNSTAYPIDPFGFAVVGVSGGKAFSDNARFVSEYNWAHNVATRAQPTFYLNVNAPYGSAATEVNVSGPKACPTPFGASVYSKNAGGTYPDPASCAGYNFGYQTAEHAYAYASSKGLSSPLWWLDVEEANSWSDDQAVNRAVVQGAIDALNAHDIRAGIYSVPYMWNYIMGKGYTPTQTIDGNAVPIPTWFPIGIGSRTDALNACHTKASFIPGSPVWIIQYVADSTAVDQNVAC